MPYLTEWEAKAVEKWQHSLQQNPVVSFIKKKRKKSKRKKQELNDLSADSHKKDGEPEKLSIRDEINNTSAEMHLPDKTIDDNCVSQEKDE